MALSNTAVPKEYATFREAVLRGDIPVNEYISMEMNRIDHLIASPEFYYDDQALERYVNFCESELVLTNGDPLYLLPSFKLWAEQLYCWYYFIDEKVWVNEKKRYEIRTVKKRLTNKQFLIVARGAAKSMYDSTIQSKELVTTTETTHQIIVAPTMRQANETIMPMKTAITVARGPLYKFLTSGSILSNSISKVKLASTKEGIRYFITNSLCEVRPLSIDKLQGLKVKVATLDEWLSGKLREDPIAAIEQGASKVQDYIIVATSSEGNERDGVGDSIKMELLSILRGEFYAPHISIWYYRLDHPNEVAHPDLWLKANPNLGATTSYDTYEKEVQTMENTPHKRNEILAKRFGIPMEGATFFFTYEETLRHNKQNYDGMECAVGADMSQGDDFCAFDFVFPLGGDRFGVKALSFVSELKMSKLPPAMKKKYRQLEKEGTLRIKAGAILDMDEIYEEVDAYISQHNYAPVVFGYDPYNAESFCKRWAADYGEFGMEIVRQGYRTESVPLGIIKKLAENRTLIFDEELMKFSMGNAIIIEDTNGNMKLSKRRSIEKIDNVAALMDAMVAYLRNREVFE